MILSLLILVPNTSARALVQPLKLKIVDLNLLATLSFSKFIYEISF